MTLMPVRREGNMKKLALIALIMVMGLSECASSSTSVSIKEEWYYYWKNPAGAGLSWEDIKVGWRWFLN